MGYQLGIDLGTTWTAAAVLRDGVASMVELSQRSTAIPSVVLVRDDSILVGQAAEQRASVEPSRVARQFKRRMGDSTPLLLGGSPYSAEAITARLLGWVVQEVSRHEGAGPNQLVLTHPANWGDYKLDLLRQAVVLAKLHIPTRFITEPEAAAVHYASKERVDPGTIIGVYDLGGGTFDASVLRKTLGGFEFLGQPAGIERLGGIDFDEAVFQRVIQSLGIDLSQFDEHDQAMENALRRLRDDCVIAKETLSTDTDTAISVLLPTVQTEVRLTRAEFEAMIRPTLADTITVTERSFMSAGIAIDEIDRILLVGGSSRIPVVAELLATRFARPLAVDAHPKNAVALGAVLSAAPATPSAPSPGAAAPSAAAMAVPIHEPAPHTPPPAPALPPTAPGTLDPVALAPAASPAVHPVSAYPSGESGGPHLDATVVMVPPAPPAPVRKTGKGLLAVVAVVLIAGVIGALVVLNRDDGRGVTPEVAAPEATAVEPTAEAGISNQPAFQTSTAPPTVEAVEPATPTAAPVPTVAPASGFYEGVQCEAVQELCIDITSVELLEGELLIGWDANFVPNVADRNHAHFYWSTFSPLQAGAGGNGDWEVSDTSPHLAGTFGEAITAARRPPGADICVTVANPDHSVRDPAIYQCWRYPE